MKKTLSLLLTGVVSVAIFAGLALGKSNSKVLANSLINNNKLSKYEADYKFSIKDSNNNDPIKFSLNVANDLNENNSIIDSKIKVKNINKEIIIYSTKDKDFIKLQNFDNYIYCPNTISSINLRLINFNKGIAYKSLKNFEKYICDLSSKKKTKLENTKDMKVLNLELNHNEIKILYDKFIQINMDHVKDLFMESLINESEDLNNTKLSLEDKNALKDKTEKELEKGINNIINDVYIDKMKVSLYIDKKKELLKEYKTTTEVLVNGKRFFIDLDYKLIDYGDNVKIKHIDMKDALSYEEFLKSKLKNLKKDCCKVIILTQQSLSFYINYNFFLLIILKFIHQPLPLRTYLFPLKQLQQIFHLLHEVYLYHLKSLYLLALSYHQKPYYLYLNL